MVKTSRHALAVAMGLLLGSTAALAEREIRQRKLGRAKPAVQTEQR